MPSLYLLNGNPGMGKSTLAKRYADEHPMTLDLDVDRLWHMMGQWQASLQESGRMKIAHALRLADVHLDAGYDVIVADLFESADICARFEQIARTHHAVFQEFVLLSSADDAIERCKARARGMGYPDGFRPGGVLDTNGREQKLQSMYDNVVQVAAERPDTIRIESVRGQQGETYAALLRAMQA